MIFFDFFRHVVTQITQIGKSSQQLIGLDLVRDEVISHRVADVVDAQKLIDNEFSLSRQGSFVFRLLVAIAVPPEATAKALLK